MSFTPTTQYILFKTVERNDSSCSARYMISWGLGPKESWREDSDDKPEKNSKSQESLEFVCRANTPQEIAAAVRKNPLERYVLFHGTMTEVRVAMPVFVGGKNLDTLNAEWGCESPAAD